MSWLDDATIEGRLVHAVIGQAIQTARLMRALDEASTVVLGVLDPQRELLGSDLWRQASRMQADSHTYVLVRTERRTNKFALTFEDAIVYALRQNEKHRVSRGSETWVDFIARLAKEASVKVYCPEAATAIGLNHRVPNRGATPPTNVPRDQPAGTTGGFEAGTTPTVTNHGLPNAGRRPWTNVSGEQLRNMVIAMNVATEAVQRLHLSANYANAVMVSMMAAGTGENGWHRASKDERSDGPLGVFQQFLSSGYTAPHDVAIATHEFLFGAGTWGPPITYQALGTRNMIGILRGVTNYSDQNLGRLIGLAQGSDQGAAYYSQFVPEARANVAMWAGAPSSTTTAVPSAPTATTQRQWSRGTAQATESTWDCAKRIAATFGFRVFIGPDGRLWMVTDAWLINRHAVAELHENDGVVETIEWTIDAGRKLPANSARKTQPMDVCTVNALDTWNVQPGSVVRLKGEGPADGRWLVSRWERDAVKPQSTIQLAKPVEKLPPPTFATGGREGGTPATAAQTYQVGTALVQPIPAVPGLKLDAKGARVQGLHPTDGLPGYQAIDFGGAGGGNVDGAPAVAVESGVIVTREVGSTGHDPTNVPAGPIAGPGVFGFNIYLRGDSGTTYFYTHLAKMSPPDGTRVQAGQVISTIANWHIHGRPDHIHLGVHPGPSGHPDINDVDNAPRAVPSGGSGSTPTTTTPATSIRSEILKWSQYGIDHTADIFYGDFIDVPLNLSIAQAVRDAGPVLDCVTFLTAVYKQAGAPDPCSHGYSGEDVIYHTDRLLKVCTHIAQADAKIGDLVVFGTNETGVVASGGLMGLGHHAAILMEDGAANSNNPWLASHGGSPDPVKVRYLTEKASQEGDTPPHTGVQFLRVKGLA